MAPFDRPVRAGDIARSPELALRYPAEARRLVGSTADEGVGTGFADAEIETFAPALGRWHAC